MAYRLMYNYLQYDSFNKSTTEWKHGVTLPAISICGTNYLNFTKLKAQLKADNEHEAHREGETLEEEFIALMRDVRKFASYGVNLTDEDWERAYDLLSWEKKKGSIAVRFRTDIYDMVVGHYEYIFRGVGYHVDEEHKLEMINPTELGMCLEINDKQELVQDVLGENGRLTIDVDAKVNDYLFTTSTKGFIVFVRDYDETVMLDQGGYLIAPGTETFIKLTGKNITRLGKPHGTCKNKLSKYSKYGNRFEGVRECQERQQIEAMISHCNCIPWYFAERMYNERRFSELDEAVEMIKSSSNGSGIRKEMDHRARRKRSETLHPENGSREHEEKESKIFHSNYTEYICTFVEQSFCNGLISNEIKTGILKFKGCPEPCQYNAWNVELDSTVFPSTNEYFEHFIKADSHLSEENDFTYARENMARIHLFYKELKIDKVSQEQAYDTSSFIAEFGGTVDLFIGFSFFTVFQLIEIGIASLYRIISRRREMAQKSEENKKSSNTNGK